jgi:hypothetical protein
LNPRPLGYEPNELPDCSTPRQSHYRKTREKQFQIRISQFEIRNSLVGLGRVELPTSRLSGVRSNQLSYRPLVSSAPFLTQKRATLLFCRSVMTVDPREGRVASVANYCLRSTLLPNFKRTILKSNSISEN